MIKDIQNQNKSALRQLMQQKRQEISENSLEHISREMLSHLLKSPLYQDAGRIFLYASSFGEVPSDNWLSFFWEAGKTTCFPRCQGKGIMDFYPAERADFPLLPGFKGIREPAGNTPLFPEKNDLLLIPGLTFSRKGARLGYGGGYYDRYLSTHPLGWRIGIVPSQWMISSLPTDIYDMPMQFLLTEKSLFPIKEGSE